MSAAVFPMSRARALPSCALPPLAVLVVVALAMVVLFGAAMLGLAVYVSGLAGAVLLAWVAWRWPTQTAIALVVLIPLARFISFAVFVPTHSTTLLRASQLWKDEAIVVLAGRMLHGAFLRHQLPRVHFIDLLIVAFVALSAMYVFYPGVIDGSTYLVRALAFRQDALYLLVYFIGRGITLRRRDVRMMLIALICLSVAIAVVAVFQFVAPGLNNRIFVKLGYPAFETAIGTPFETASVRSRLLSSGTLPRASSLFLADLGLAFYQVLLIPIAASLFFAFRGRVQQVLAGLFLLAMIGTMGLTVARAPLIGAVSGLVLLIFISRSFIKGAWATLGVVAMVLALLVASGYSFGVFRELYSGTDSSAAAHTGYIDRSLALVTAHPLGEGLGNGSHVSVLAKGLGQGGLPSWATETWYLQLGLEMGVVAMALFAALLLAATCNSLLSGVRIEDPWLRGLCLGVGGAGAGYVLVSAFHPVWSAVQVSYLFWLFVGIAVRGPVLEAEWSREGAADREDRDRP